MKKIFIVTGEHSGDSHAAYVVQELKKLNKNLEIKAIGSNELRNQGVELFEDHSKMSVMGLSFKAIIDHLNIAKRVINFLKYDFQPDIVLLIDYGGFNLRLAKKLRKNGIKVFYYISPQVWASRKGRIQKIKKYINKMMVIFPFEEDIHKIAGVNAEYVGHPLISQMPANIDKDDFINMHDLDKSKKIVGIFPGSRKMEIKYMLPVFLKAAKIMQEKDNNIQFCICQASNLPDDLINDYISKNAVGLDFKLLKNQNHPILANSDVLMLKSGTVTLEASLYKTPMIISYKGPAILYPIYLLVRHIKVIGLPNIIFGKDVVKEFVQYKAKPELIANELLDLLNNQNKRDEMVSNLEHIQEQLGDKIASKEVARIITEELNKEN